MTFKSSYHRMAYEVTKTIAGRAYRYRVESVRDAETGKRRSRWTYLGRVEGRPNAGAAPKRRSDAGRRLLDALERLLESTDFASVTADAIATEAGLAHGTFYRHFRDKRDALRAALQRIREERGTAVEALRSDVANLADARADLSGFVERILSSPADHPGLLRASYALGARDEEVALEWRTRRAKAVRLLAGHLAALTARGIATVRDPEATAGALIAMVDGLYRDAVLDRNALDATRIAAAADVFERAIFG
ncbi:MAG: TetR/AcrR family transcriptional regulator [Candidatus Eremiobacteraeota bacterium]|nr:TetR/AcrR family transcriptional regulator [Candidatus Eremiobacteraeota bacterium]